MRESFVIDRKKLYGFDYDSEVAAWSAAWAQSDQEPIFEEAIEEVSEEISEEAVSEEELSEEMDGEVSAKEAFFEFAHGVAARTPVLPRVPHTPPRHQVHPHPMPVVPPRPPQVHPHPMPVVPPRPPLPTPGPGHNFNPRSGSAPRFAPPAFIPQRAPGLRMVDPGAISRCLYSNTYVWLNNRQDFWFFPTFVGRKSIAGYRWMHRNWVFMGFGLNMVDSFFCGGR